MEKRKFRECTKFRTEMVEPWRKESQGAECLTPLDGPELSVHSVSTQIQGAARDIIQHNSTSYRLPLPITIRNFSCSDFTG
ncbi:hypothetical protein RRG08_050937 [Elysia crispata]|uniref:Uncharacterized protein n=1 Tax=Elysia crispata TaxID=231223 RepID=A0AAE0YQJ9_9GAST|nr:hypothetical protein RRG08_050937 [Elysia crispata]